MAKQRPEARRSAAEVRAEIERRLLELPGVERRASRFGDGGSYFAGDREIAHFHGDERMDVRLTKEAIRDLKESGSVDPRIRPRGGSAEWLEVRVHEPRDVAFAVSLVEDAVRNNS
jgi:hypothetical protein